MCLMVLGRTISSLLLLLVTQGGGGGSFKLFQWSTPGDGVCSKGGRRGSGEKGLVKIAVATATLHDLSCKQTCKCHASTHAHAMWGPMHVPIHVSTGQEMLIWRNLVTTWSNHNGKLWLPTRDAAATELSQMAMNGVANWSFIVGLYQQLSWYEEFRDCLANHASLNTFLYTPV